MAEPTGLPAYTGNDSIAAFPGTESYNDLSTSLQQKITGIAQTNPFLVKDPQSVLALAQSINTNPEQTALALKYATTAAERLNACSGDPKVNAAAAAKINAPRPGLWGDITSTLSDVGKGAYNAVSGIVTSGANAVNRIGISANELLGGHGTAGYKDLWHTTTNLGENVNPFSDKSVLNMPNHILAYEESMVRQHGYAYALGQAIPAIAGAVISDGATTAAEGGTEAALAGDQAVVDAANAAQKAGQALTDEQKIAAGEAAQRLADSAKRLDEIKAAQAARRADRSPAFQAAINAAKTVAAPLRPAMKALDVISRPGRNVPLNSFYVATSLQAQGQDPALWEQTKNGTVIGADGKPVSAVGEALQMLGMSPNSEFYNPINNLGTMYLTTFAADPLAAGLGVVKTAKSTEGFAGGLGQWWGGTGIRSADDIERTAQQYPAVQRAYNYMATHSASEIYTHFNGTISPELAQKLGKAQDLPSVYAAYRETINTMAKVADGRGLVITDAPKIGLWSGFKTVLKGAIVRQATTLGEALGSDELFTKAFQDGIKENRFDAKPDGAAFYAANADVRWRAVWARKLAGQFYKESMWVDTLTAKIENVHVTPGDPAAIGPLMDLARLAMVPNETVKSMGDFLLATKNPDDYTQAFTNCVTMIVNNLARAGLPKTTLDLMGSAVENEVFKNVVALVGKDRGGDVGTYVAGPEGEFYSRLGNPESEGIGAHAAIDDTQKGSLIMPRARDVKNLAKAMREAALIASADAKDLTQPAKDFESLARVIRYSSVDVKDASFAWKKIVEATDVRGMSKAYQEAFDTKIKGLAETLAGTLKNKDLTSPERFLSVYQKVTDEQARLEAQIALRSTEPLKAQYEANQTLLSALNGTIPDSSTFGREDFLQYARDMAERRGIVADDRADFAKDYANEMEKARQRDPYYRNNWQHTVDFLNATQSKFFVPMALLSNGWALRVSISELLLNGYRMGWGTMLQSHLTNSILKHEMVDDTRLWARTEPDHWWGLGKGKLTPVRDIPENASLLIKSNNLKARAVRVVRDIVAGSLLGIEERLLEGYNEAERLRMIDHTVSTVMRHKGYMPMDVHQVEGAIYDPGLLNQRIADKYVDIDPSGRIGILKASRTGQYVPVSLGQNGYVAGLRDALLRQGTSELKAPLYSHIYDKTLNRGLDEIEKGLNTNPDKMLNAATKHVEQYYKGLPNLTELLQKDPKFSFRKLTRDLLQEKKPSGALEEFVLGLGAKTLNSQAEKQLLMAELQGIAENKLRSLTPSELAAYRRSELTLLREGETDPIKGWAEALAYDSIHHVSGFSPVRDAEGISKPVFHGTLIRQTTNVDNVKSVQSIAEEVKAMGDTAPVNIPTRGFEAYHALQAGTRTNLIQDISRYGHERILGPIVNNLSRDPIWAHEFHVQMELREPMIAAGVISREQAEAEAEYKAVMNMSQFVHNPKDKLVFERNMRVAAPFYFAQNQAYRRFFRLLGDNPAAAERYMKMCLALTNYVAGHTQNGQTPSLYIPGSTYLTGVVGKIFGFNGVVPDIGLAASPTSINTVVPTGSSTGTDMFGTFARPSFGPVVDIPLKFAHEHFFQNNEFVDKVYRDFLGPVGSQTSIWDDVVPNSTARALFTIAESPLKTNTALLSTQLSVMKSTLSELYAKMYDEEYAKDAQTYINQGIPQSQLVQLIRANADAKFVNFFQGETNSAEAQKFLDAMHSQALALYILKSAVNASSPVAISTMERFSQEPKLQAILNQKNKDGSPKYTVSEGLDLFAQQHPDHLLDLVTKTSGSYESYPETTAALSFLTQYRGVVQKYPYGSAMLIPQTGQYSSAAYQLETSMGLRTLDTPEEYLRSILTSIGDDYYYNYLRPMAMDAPGGSQTYSDGTIGLSYEGQKSLTTMAQTYAKQSNPTWGQYGSVINPTAKSSVAFQAFDNVKAMLNDPKATPLFGGNKAMYAQLVNYTEQFQQLLQTATPAEAGNLRPEWYDYCTNLAQSPEAKPAAYFITSVMRRLGTKAGL